MERRAKKAPARGGMRVGASPERVNKLTGMPVGGTRMRNGGKTCLERPKAKPKPKVEKPKPKPTNSYVKSSYTVNRDGHKLGGDAGKWRCKTCKFMNAKENEKCHMCSEEKQVLRESRAPVGQAARRRTKQVKTHQANKPKKPEESKGGFGAQVRTLGDIDPNEKFGKPKQKRFDDRPTLEKLKYIAQNSDKCDVMPCMREVKDVKDCRFVEETRDPAKFNAMTFDREFGGMPK